MSANGCPTEKISALVDHFLKPYIPQQRSYVRDTSDFIAKLDGVKDLPEGIILATIDVTSLYTNIPTQEGIQSVAHTLRTNRPDHTAQPKNDSLVKLLEMVLTMNNFQFNGENFLQIQGTAMGTKVAPSYANDYMGNFEEKHVYTYPTQPLLWLRFIDDIFIIWGAGKETLTTFLDHLNTRNDTIRFTMESSESQVNFLDTTVKLQNGQLITDLYTKPTDSHSYLHYSSSHPQTCKDAIPYSQFLRIRRICSKLEDFDTHAKKLTGYFQQRGYPMDLLITALIRARRHDRRELLQPKQRDTETDDDNIVLVLTYHPTDRTLPNIVKQNWNILGKSTLTSHLHQKKLL